MKKLVFITTRCPYPPHGGDRVRVYFLLKELSKSFDITLVTLTNNDNSANLKLIKECGISKVVSYQQSTYEKFLGLAISLLTGTPLQVGYFYSIKIKKWAKLFNHQYDVCIFHMMRAAQYSNHFEGKIKIFEMCDANSEIFRQNIAITKWYELWHWISIIESKRALILERKAVKEFNLITLHTAHDAKIISPTLDKILISTQGVMLEQKNFLKPSNRIGDKIAFIGKIDFHPNLDAINWFIESILPNIPSNIKLKIIGPIPENLRNTLSRNNRVEITGSVRSISEATQDCFVGIAPMRSAAGIQNKVLDYFSLGLPAITNANVLKGLLPEAKKVIILAESKKDWIKAITDVFQKNIDLDLISKNAYDYVNENHNWEKIGNEYAERIKAIIL